MVLGASPQDGAAVDPAREEVLVMGVEVALLTTVWAKEAPGEGLTGGDFSSATTEEESEG